MTRGQKERLKKLADQGDVQAKKLLEAQEKIERDTIKAIKAAAAADQQKRKEALCAVGDCVLDEAATDPGFRVVLDEIIKRRGAGKLETIRRFRPDALLDPREVVVAVGGEDGGTGFLEEDDDDQ